MELDYTTKSILERLQNAGYSAYVAGGAVRDTIMGKTPSDYDIATSAKPNDIKSLFRRTIDTGIKHGTVTVVENKMGFEVTTFREETEYSDMRHPDSVNYVSDVKSDLRRRDFTINAMAYGINDGLIDLFGGQEDIKNRIVKCVGNAETRFKEDALRMLRCVRFAACLDFKIEDNTFFAIKKCAVLIKNVSCERILTELNKILLSDHPEKIKLLYDTGLMKYIMPEMCKCFVTEQNNRYHIYDVGNHIIKTVENAPKDLVLRWSAFLHDIGKPNCQSKDANGIYHFYGHHKESVRVADFILHKLRMDNDSMRDILTLIENHDVHIDATPVAVKKMLARTGEALFFKLLSLQEADNRAKNPNFIEDKLTKLDAVSQKAQQIILENQPYMVSQLQINGRDLIKLGYKAGREIGDVLKFLLDEVLIDPKLNNREYLVKRAIALKKHR